MLMAAIFNPIQSMCSLVGITKSGATYCCNNRVVSSSRSFHNARSLALDFLAGLTAYCVL